MWGKRNSLPKQGWEDELLLLPFLLHLSLQLEGEKWTMAVYRLTDTARLRGSRAETCLEVTGRNPHSCYDIYIALTCLLLSWKEFIPATVWMCPPQSSCAINLIPHATVLTGGTYKSRFMLLSLSEWVPGKGMREVPFPFPLLHFHLLWEASKLMKQEGLCQMWGPPPRTS